MSEAWCASVMHLDQERRSSVARKRRRSGDPASAGRQKKKGPANRPPVLSLDLLFRLVCSSVGALSVALAAEVAISDHLVLDLSRAVAAFLADRSRGAGEEDEAKGVLVAVSLVARDAARRGVRVGNTVVGIDLDLRSGSHVTSERRLAAQGRGANHLPARGVPQEVRGAGAGGGAADVGVAGRAVEIAVAGRAERVDPVGTERRRAARVGCVRRLVGVDPDVLGHIVRCGEYVKGLDRRDARPEVAVDRRAAVLQVAGDALEAVGAGDVLVRHRDARRRRVPSWRNAGVPESVTLVRIVGRAESRVVHSAGRAAHDAYKGHTLGNTSVPPGWNPT